VLAGSHVLFHLPHYVDLSKIYSPKNSILATAFEYALHWVKIRWAPLPHDKLLVVLAATNRKVGIEIRADIRWPNHDNPDGLEEERRQLTADEWKVMNPPLDVEQILTGSLGHIFSLG
jgi:hypothetical protein